MAGQKKGGSKGLVRLGLPLGAMEDEAVALMNDADLRINRLTPHFGSVDDPRISDALFQMPRELWTMVQEKALDAALVPFDEVAKEMRRRPIVKRLHIEPLIATLLFIANAESWREKETELQDLLMLLRGAAEARGRVLLKLHVPKEHLEAVLKLLPALKAPTVIPLQVGEPNLLAVEAVVPRSEVNRLIPDLLRTGAMDLVELPITKLIPGSPPEKRSAQGRKRGHGRKRGQGPDR